jgi:transcription elongation factor SPT6
MSDIEEEGLVREEFDEEMKEEEGEGDSLDRSDDEDSEEEEEEEQITAEDLKFIADDDEEDEPAEEVEEERRKKKKRKKPVLEDLSDDDLDLIQENIGQKKKLKRRDYDLQNLFEQEFEQGSDDMEDFIIRDGSDDEGPIMRESQNLALELGVSDAQWRDIDELFGTGDDYPHALGLQLDDGEESTQKKEITIKDVYEPSEIQAKMLTEQDELIRIRDVPERFQRTEGRMHIPDDNEISREANIITKTFMGRFGNVTENTLNQAVTCVLRFLRRDQFEVPFIFRHRRDYFDNVLEIQDLWRIVDLDDKFIQVEAKKKSLMELIVQVATIDASIETDEQVAHFVERIVTLDDVNDTLAHIHLKYSTQIAQLQSTQSHRRMFKRAPWKVLYDDAIKHGMQELAGFFGINIADFVQSVINRQSLHSPEDHYDTPNDSAMKFVNTQFPTVEIVLDAARHLIAQEIAAHPQIRAFIRRVFMTDSVVCVEPTEKGKKEIEQHHPYYVLSTNKGIQVSEG